MDYTPDAIPVDDNAIGYNQFITSTWDTLLNDYPTEIEKEIIMQDSSNTFNIYKYIITPKYYQKTVLLTAGCHGNEYEGFYSLYRFIRELYDNGYKNSHLNNIRHNVRFIIIPVWNPWGVEHRDRNNSLGFPSHNNVKSVTVNGTTYPAFYCNEILSVKSTIEEYKSDLSLWIDLHTDPYTLSNTSNKGIYGYAVKTEDIHTVLYNMTKNFQRIIKDRFNYDSTFTIYSSSATSSGGLTTWGNNVMKIPTSLIEVGTYLFAQSGSAELMKISQEWYTNVICNMILVTK